MKQTSRILIIILLPLSLAAALYVTACAGCWAVLNVSDGGFARSVSFSERQHRLELVSAAQQWLGTQEGSPQHTALLQTYNAHEPLARGYTVTATDNWCATFCSTVAIQCGMTGIIPTECGCERQIDLWKNAGRWTENDNHTPLPGDYIYYNWNERWSLNDNTGWSDHVGIVVGTAGPFIKVIEGNKDDCVIYRIILRGNWQIRGYGLPDYASIG